MSDIFGQVKPPDAIARFQPVEQGGIGQILTIIATMLIAGAGVYALFNFILAGYAFMSAGNDPGKVEGAWAKIYQTIIGLAFAAGAFVLASIVGRLLFGEWTALTNPVIPTP